MYVFIVYPSTDLSSWSLLHSCKHAESEEKDDTFPENMKTLCQRKRDTRTAATGACIQVSRATVGLSNH